MLAQSPNEVAGRGLFDSSAGARTAGTRRIVGFGFGFGFGEDGVVAGLQALDVAGGQCLEVLVLADQGIGLAQLRSRRCSMSAVCSATCSRNRLSSSSGFSRKWVRVGCSSMGLDYVCSLPLGKRS